MKQKITLLLILSVGFINAQPIINSLNLPTNFEANAFYGGNPGGFDVGSSGSNVTWDYSSLIILEVGTYKTIPVAGSTYSSNFPTSNLCFKQTYFGSDFFFYHKQSSTKLEMLSFGYNIAAGSGYSYTTNPKTLFEFPFVFNTSFIDSYQSQSDPNPISDTIIYDAFGTLIMPFGTYNNVIRKKISLSDGTINYSWWNSNPLYPILEADNVENNIYIYQPTLVSNNKELVFESEISISPNPTNEKTYINFNNEQKNISITIFDEVGKELKNIKFSGKQFILDRSNFVNGIYYINFKNSNGELVCKKLIVR
jgi:hypothetical protein